MNVRMESYEYESAYALGPNSGNTERDDVAIMIDRCNDMGVDTIETGNMMAMAMEMTEEGKLDDIGGLDWGDTETMIDMIERIAHRENDLADLQPRGHAACRSARRTRQLPGRQGSDDCGVRPALHEGMGIGYATSNRGPATCAGTRLPPKFSASREGRSLRVGGKGELTAAFQDLHAISDSFDICKFNAFAEGIEEYVLQYNGMTGLDVTEEELLEAGERVYNLERYYNNLAGFDGSDDSYARFLEDGIRGQGASEGEYCELEG